MTYSERGQLTVIELQNHEESVSMEEIKRVLLEYPSNVIYCETQQKLVGIISTGDIYRAYSQEQDKVHVNKEFTYLYSGEYTKARAILKGHINEVPIITKDNILIGEYACWDDIMLLECFLNTRGRHIDMVQGQKIALVHPCKFYEKKQKLFEKLKNCLQHSGVNIICINRLEIYQYWDVIDKFLFIDENEIRAYRTWIILMHDDYYCDENKLVLCKDVLGYDKVIAEKYALYLEKLHSKGVEILGLTLSECQGSYRDEIRERFAKMCEPISSRIPNSMYSQFFDDLYNEEYAEQIMDMPFRVKNDRGVLKLHDCCSRYYNVVNGERCTSDQPKKYGKTIYFYGPCYIWGYNAEDKNTIESLLQKHLKDKKDEVKVVNCGCMWMNGACGCLPRIEVTALKRGDIIVIDRPPENIYGLNYLDLDQIMRKNHANVEWIIDSPLHCNHKIYEMYAEAIYEKLEPFLKKEMDCQAQLIEKSNNIIKMLYLDPYFVDFNPSKYENIGSIVMNCNPFTYGHRYLIEQALNIVDFLIVFVVEEDASVFSFAERFTMVSRGVMDLENVMVVPSGPYILSQMSFSEYFVKETSEDIIEHTEQDIIIFAKDIAPQLGIKYRFVGEELEDDITNQYNLTMKKILPKYGINLIEITRKKVEGECISASSVRRYLENNNKEKLIELLPETTRRVIGII